MDRENLYVISVITNPERFETRTRLFKQFKQRMTENHKVQLVIVECVQGARPFELTEENNPLHIQLRTTPVLWLKENLINIAISRLPNNWKYVAWIDGDIEFTNPNWVEDTIHELQIVPIVQMFEDAIDMGPKYEVMHTWKSFASCWTKEYPICLTHEKRRQLNPYYGNPEAGTYWHSGYAWAATREFINGVGGLIDFAICGAGDHHMACALIGEVDLSVPGTINKHYLKLLHEWQMRALRTSHKHLTYIPGSIIHYWHGKKRDRKYADRWRILSDNDYDPTRDIHRDSQGIIVLHPSNIKLRDGLRRYFQARNEDSIDL